MTEYAFTIDPERFTLDDMIAMEERSYKGTRDLLAKFLTVGGQAVPEAEARRMLGALTIPQLNGVVDRFIAAIRQMQDGMIPQASGGA